MGNIKLNVRMMVVGEVHIWAPKEQTNFLLRRLAKLSGKRTAAGRNSGEFLLN
ncbi:hypothetical protein N752_05575 [Desulforamulus aquiferis]|nr:hypothetical protein N752_05575 [Desulforamulus aquiferis]